MRLLLFSFTNIVALVIATPVSSHFYHNVSIIPRSFIPSNSTWNHFNKYLGCRVGQKIEGLAQIKQYFQHFGYIDNSFNNNFSDEFDQHLFSALNTYQLNFNLNITGEFDIPTLQHMVKPRCGNPDIVNGTTDSKSPTDHTVAHYSFFKGSFFEDQPRWPSSKTKLMYAFLPENQLTDSVKAAFGRAFDQWSKVTPLTFQEMESYRLADIRIGFFVRDHGDGNPFDGPMKIVAHAFAPPIGILHLDGEENWVVDGELMREEMVDLESVAVHEIGHILGLAHSSEKEAVMFPTLEAGVRKVELSRDDIEGVQMIYGSSTDYTHRQENDISGYSTYGSWCPHWIIGFFLALVHSIFL